MSITFTEEIKRNITILQSVKAMLRTRHELEMDMMDKEAYRVYLNMDVRNGFLTETEAACLLEGRQFWQVMEV